MDYITNPSATFTRPSDTNVYAAGDLVANDTYWGNVVIGSVTVARGLGLGFMLRRLRLWKSSSVLTNARFRVHLFRTKPTTSGGDNAALGISSGTPALSGSQERIGAFDVTIDSAFTDGSSGVGVPVVGSEMGAALADGQVVYFVVEALAAYVPNAGEQFKLWLENFSA